MSTNFNAKVFCAGLTLLAPFFVEVAFADQQEFQLRREQQLRPHNFDVQHYRIELSLDEPTKSFAGATAITLSSTITGLEELALDAESFSVRSVTRQGNSMNFIQEEGLLKIALARGSPY